ncbi:MAG: hypothetical protein H8D47_03170, partial [Planctomycetes bacterium]|nr:hypothetical protein [Planctomycetota bacterium]
MWYNSNFLHHKTELLLFLLFLFTPKSALAGPADFNIDGVFEAALDLPRIKFLLKREPNGLPLEYEGNFELNWAFLDTGASGILLSRETADYLEIDIEPDAEYSDIGIGGIEFFDVSEPLYVCTIGYNHPEPYEPNNYLLIDSWRLQVKQHYASEWPDEPLDLLGMPVMAGKTVVLDSRGPSTLEYFTADIKEPNDPTIPEVDFNVALRFEKYITPTDPNNIPPLPVLAYNPVIDNIVAEYNNKRTSGTFLLDSGGTISLMSTSHAAALGLTEPNGSPIIEPDFYIPIGGVGGQANLPGYQLDNLIIPTLNGYNLIFNNARICVHDIGIIDEDTGEFIILDGIFGSNFLCASMSMDTWDISDTAFDTIVIDMQNGLLGFDVNDIYTLPTCGDAYHPQPTADLTGDCKVNYRDLAVLANNWLSENCSSANDYCDNADITKTG